MRQLACAAVAVLVSLAGCADGRMPAAEARVGTSNAAYTVERLFTDEQGNAVHRFRDRGDYHYYVTGLRGPHMVPPPTRPVAGTPIPEAN